MKRPRKRMGAILALLSAVGTLAAAAHPEATLKSPVSSAQAGASMPILGETFLPDQKVKLALQGAFNEYDLPEVTAGADGTFSIQLEIPASVRPGAYRLVAIADDGEVVATLELTVDAAVAAAEHAGDHGTVGDAGVTMAARADEVPIERSRSGVEWGIIGLLVGLSAGFGIRLVRVAES